MLEDEGEVVIAVGDHLQALAPVGERVCVDISEDVFAIFTGEPLAVQSGRDVAATEVGVVLGIGRPKMHWNEFAVSQRVELKPCH